MKRVPPQNNLPENLNDYKEKTYDHYTIDAEGSPADGWCCD